MSTDETLPDRLREAEAALRLVTRERDALARTIARMIAQTEVFRDLANDSGAEIGREGL